MLLSSLKLLRDSGDGSELRAARLEGFCELFQLQGLSCCGLISFSERDFI